MAREEADRAGDNAADDETLRDGAATSASGQVRSELTSTASMLLQVEFGAANIKGERHSKPRGRRPLPFKNPKD